MGSSILKKLPFLKNKEVKNAGWIIGARVVHMVFSLIVSILSARFLGPSNYGLVNYGITYANFFMSLCTLGINSVIVKEFVDNPDQRGEALGTTIVLRLISSFLSVCMIIIISLFLDHGEPETIVVVALCAISLMFHGFETIGYYFQSLYQSKYSSIVSLIAYVVASVYKIVLLVCGMSVRWFAVATSVDYAVIAVLEMIVYKKKNGPKLTFSWAKGKYLLSKSYHYILSGLMVSIYGQTDKLMLKQMIDESSVGFYSIGVSVSNIWVFVLSAIIDSMYPTIMSLHKTSKLAFERKNKQLYAIVFYVSVAVSLLFTVFGKIAIRILYGVEYDPAYGSLSVVTWYTAFSYLGVARNAWIVCEDKQKYLKYTYFAAAIMNVILNAALIPLWGATGAAVASLLTQIFTSMGVPALIPGMRPNVKLMIDAILLKGVLPERKKIK